MDREELKRLTKEEKRTPSRRGERNGYYTRDLITPAGRIAQLRVPRDREGAFLTEVFVRYKRTTGEVAVRLGLGPQSGPGRLGSSPARGAW